MIYCVTGKLIHTEPELAVVSCSGVGFACRTSMNTLMKISSQNEVTLYTHLTIRERDETAELFGFATQEELNWFRMLTSVSGVGAKAAIAILSSMSGGDLAVAIASGDAKAFTKIKGLGTKTAQRIVLELKSKVTSDQSMFGVTEDYSSVQSEGSSAAEATQALVALGYTQSEAATAIAKMGKDLSVEEYIKGALKALSVQ